MKKMSNVAWIVEWWKRSNRPAEDLAELIMNPDRIPGLRETNEKLFPHDSINNPYFLSVNDLLDRLLAAGFIIRWTDNRGGEGGDDDEGIVRNPTKAAAMDEIFSVDMSELIIAPKHNPKDIYVILIVLGNDLNEIVADYTYKKDPETGELTAASGLIDEITEAIYDDWA